MVSCAWHLRYVSRVLHSEVTLGIGNDRPRNDLAPVVWKVDNAIQRIHHSSLDSVVCGNPYRGSGKNLRRLGLDFWLPEMVKFLCVFHVNWQTFVSLQGKVNIPSNRVEQLYEAMLPNLPQYVVSLGWAGGIGGLNIPLPLIPHIFLLTRSPLFCDSLFFVTCLTAVFYTNKNRRQFVNIKF